MKQSGPSCRPGEAGRSGGLARSSDSDSDSGLNLVSRVLDVHDRRYRIFGHDKSRVPVRIESCPDCQKNKNRSRYYVRVPVGSSSRPFVLLNGEK